MKKLLPILIFGLFPLSLNAGILPSITFLEFQKLDRIKTMTITNTSDKKTQYKVRLIDLIQNKDGSYQTPNFNKKTALLDDYLYYSPKSFTLGPKERQTIRILKKQNKFAGLATGEYRSHINITEIGKEAKGKNNGDSAGLAINLQSLVGITLPILIKKGDTNHVIEFSNFTLTNKDNKPALDFLLKVKGNESARGNIDVFLDNKKIGFLRNIATYIPLKERKVSVPLYSNIADNQIADIKNISGKEITIEYRHYDAKENTPAKYVKKTIANF